MTSDSEVFRYDTSGYWFRGNTHIHSIYSDGIHDFGQLADFYRQGGYDFCFRTDHWVASSIEDDRQDYPILWIDGIELDGVDSHGDYYHVVGLGECSGIERSMGLVGAMEEIQSRNGLLVLAHPHWTDNTFEQALRWNFNGVEVYNHICQWLNGRGNSHVFWTKMLDRNPNTFAFASDDTHRRTAHPDWNGGWISVNAPVLTADAVMNAIRAGNFYASTGPAFHSIEMDGAFVRVTTSPVRVIRIVGPGWVYDRQGTYDGTTLTEASFPAAGISDYRYIEIEDAHGRCAWTNTLFT